MEKHYPNSRFGAFNAKWAVSEASNIFSIEAEKGYPDLPVLSASQEFGMVKRDSIGINMQYSKQNIASYKRVQPGRFVIHLRSFQGGFAHSAIEGITSPAYTVLTLRDSNKHDDYFWKYLLTSPEFIKRLELVTYGIRDGRSISVEDFMGLPFCFPSTKDEQHQIAQLFSRLDILIAAEDKKLEKLKNFKNASLEKMFPKKGESTPQVRFKGFTREWETKELSEVAGYYRVSNENVHHQNLLSLSYGKIVRKNIKSKKGLLPASFDTYQVIKEGIIVLRFTDLQNDHKSLRVGLSKEEGIISPAYICLECMDNINPDYLYLLLHYYDLCKVFYGMGDGLRQTLSYSDIKELPLFIPKDEKEQKRIVDFFTKLDVIISSQEKKTHCLRSLKKAFLERMFVSAQ